MWVWCCSLRRWCCPYKLFTLSKELHLALRRPSQFLSKHTASASLQSFGNFTTSKKRNLRAAWSFVRINLQLSLAVRRRGASAWGASFLRNKHIFVPFFACNGRTQHCAVCCKWATCRNNQRRRAETTFTLKSWSKTCAPKNEVGHHSKRWRRIDCVRRDSIIQLERAFV